MDDGKDISDTRENERNEADGADARLTIWRS